MTDMTSASVMAHEGEEETHVDTQASMDALTTALLELGGAADVAATASFGLAEASLAQRHEIAETDIPTGRLSAAVSVAFHDVEPSFQSTMDANETFQVVRDAVLTHTIGCACYSDWTMEALGLVVAEEVVFTVAFTRVVADGSVRVAFHLLQGDSMHFLDVVDNIQRQCRSINKHLRDLPETAQSSLLSKWTARNDSNVRAMTQSEDMLRELLEDISSDTLHTLLRESYAQQLKDACLYKTNREILRLRLSDELLHALLSMLRDPNEATVRYGLFILLQYSEEVELWSGLIDLEVTAQRRALASIISNESTKCILSELEEGFPVTPEGADVGRSKSVLSADALRRLEETSTHAQSSGERRRSGSISRAITRMRDAFSTVFSRRPSVPPVHEYAYSRPVPRHASKDMSKPTASEAGTYTSEWTVSSTFSGQSADDAGILQTFMADPVISVSRISTDGIDILRELGRGSSGQVYLGQYEERLVAIRRLLPAHMRETRHIKIFCDDIRLMTKLEHPKIAAFIGVSWDTLHNLSAIAEYMEGGALNHILYETDRPLSWSKEKLSIAADVIEALIYLHTIQPTIIHRDLWSKNVLLTGEGEAKLNLFKISQNKMREEAMTLAIPQSVLWMAPEVIMGEAYAEKADIYSFGVLLSELDTRQVPFSSLRDDSGARLQPFRILQMVAMKRLQVELSADCPSELKALAQQCMAFEPDDRPTAMQVAHMLRSRVAPSLLAS